MTTLFSAAKYLQVETKLAFEFTHLDFRAPMRLKTDTNTVMLVQY